MQDNFLIDRIMTVIEFEPPLKIYCSLFSLCIFPGKFVQHAASRTYIYTPGVISSLTLLPPLNSEAHAINRDHTADPATVKHLTHLMPLNLALYS